MSFLRTEQIKIPFNSTLSTLCHLSKNLYNEANYVIRQEFFTIGKWIRYNELASLFRNNDNYKDFPAQSLQQTLRVLDKSWKATFRGIKERKNNPSKFKAQVKLPHYKPKDGEAILILTNQQCKIKDEHILFPNNLKLQPIQTRLPNNTNLREVRFIPNSNHYICEIVYKTQNEEGTINRRWYSRRINKNRILGIDPGTTNIITSVNNIGEQPIVIKGGVLKSINQFYNKKKALLQSIYDKQNIKYGSKMNRLTNKRNQKIKDAMHKISRYTIDYCLKYNIGTIVIGKNDNWKQQVSLGKRNNQNFVSIPHDKLIQMITYKAEEQGIEVILQNESHTSKCSFLDSEEVCHHEVYLGNRFNRGLFRSKTGLIINSDVNGAYNIIRKAIPNAFQKWKADEIEDVGLHPVRVTPYEINC